MSVLERIMLSCYSLDIQSDNNLFLFFFFNDTATTEIYTLSLHDALPILQERRGEERREEIMADTKSHGLANSLDKEGLLLAGKRSEEHTSELQSRQYLVCRLLLEKKKKNSYIHIRYHHNNTQQYRRLTRI